MAIAIQQKGIGERLSGSVAVRSAVSINSLSIKVGVRLGACMCVRMTLTLLPSLSCCSFLVFVAGDP